MSLNVAKSGLSMGSMLQHLWTTLRRSSCEREVELESRISGRTLFFRDIGADLGMEGEGDLSKAWMGLVVVADNMCMGEGEVMRRLE